MEKQEKNTVTPYDLDGRPPLKLAIPLGLQHVLAMFVGNLTPLLIITAACGIEAGGELQVALLQNAMLIAGIVTLVQVFTIGPVGGKLPIVMGTSSGFIGVCQSVAGVMGNGVVAYGAIMAASFIGGLFETVLGSFLKPLRKFFPSVVTGTVVLSIGLSLIAVGISSFGGGSSAKDYGSLENLFVGFVVLVVIVVLKHGTKGFTSFASILIGIIVGYVLVSIMATVLPTTFTYVDDAGATVEATKSWVLNWDKVASASWFAVPKIMPVKWVFDARAIVPICIMFIVTAVETVGDISGITEGGLGREATDKELSGGVMCDGLGSSLAAVFGVLPNTSFSQNVGLVAMNKVVNRFSIATGGIFLIACGLFPKLAALISIMPLKEETELQLLRSLSNTPLQVDVTFMAVQSHEAKNTSVSHLNKFYQTFPELKNNKYDGMIITGAPVEQMEFEEVDYWKELVEIMDWTNTHVTSTIYLCWAAQAGLYHHYGLKKRKLDKKMFGLFWHKVMNRKIPLVRGFDDMFLAPHSRHTEVPIEDIHNCKELTVLAESDEAGLFLAMADGGRKIFVMGHPEYDRVTLDGEYKRDVSKNLPIEIPENYYKDNNPENRPLLMWRAHANNLYTNWLNYYVYQSTPFDLYGTPDFSEI